MVRTAADLRDSTLSSELCGDQKNRGHKTCLCSVLYVIRAQRENEALLDYNLGLHVSIGASS